MSNMHRERAAVSCLLELERRGLEVRVVSDPMAARDLLDSTGRAFSTLPLDPQRVAFTRRNAFWIFALDDHEIYAGCGMRLDDLGDEPFSEYFARTSLPTFGTDVSVARMSHSLNGLTGRIAYWGDLIAPRKAGKAIGSNKILRMFCYYAQHRCFTDMSADASLCYMQDRNFFSGAPQSYGFMSNCTFPWDWVDCPYPGGRPDWVSFLRREQMDELTASIQALLVD